MTLDFEKYAMKGNEFLNRLEQNLGVADRAHAGRILRSTFGVLRNHLTFEESLQLIAQLPMAIKTVYVDGWKRGEHRKIKTEDDFITEIIYKDGSNAWRDFGSREEILDAVRAVLETVRSYVSGGEMEQALSTLPKRIKIMLESSSI